MEVEEIAGIDAPSSDERYQQEVCGNKNQLWWRNSESLWKMSWLYIELTAHFQTTTLSILMPRNITCTRENIPSSSN